MSPLALAILLLGFLAPAFAQVTTDTISASPIPTDQAQTSPCAATCVNNVLSNGASIGCAPGDTVCVCGKSEEFMDGIRDCVMQACVGPLGESPLQVDWAQQHGAVVCEITIESHSSITTAWLLSTPYRQPGPVPVTGVPAAQSTVANLTTTAVNPQSTATSLTTSEADMSSATETPVPATTEDGPIPTSSIPDPNLSSSIPSLAETTTPAAEQSQSSKSMWATITLDPPNSTPTPAPAPTTDSTSEPSLNALTDATTISTSFLTSSSASSTTTSGSSLESADGPKESESVPEGQGLSYPVKLGVIVGCSVAGALMVVILLYYCIRRKMRCKKSGSSPSLNISNPLPGSGRQYANEPKNFESTFPTAYSPGRVSPLSSDSNGLHRNSYSSELDRVARRYEDMAPGTIPRTMI